MLKFLIIEEKKFSNYFISRSIFKILNKLSLVHFFDVDEYLILPKYKNIHYLFNSINYDEFDIIHVNWEYFDDKELIYYDSRSLQIKFTR